MLKTKLIIYFAKRGINVPLFLVLWTSRYFAIDEHIKSAINSRPPKRMMFKKVTLNPKIKNGEYRYGTLPITIEERYARIDNIKENPLKEVARIMKIPYWVMLFANANKIFGFINHIIKDLDARAKRDASLKTLYSEEEIQAGIEKLQFGYFGHIYSLSKLLNVRVEDVEKMSDARCFAIMKIEHSQSEYNKKLNKIYTNKRRKK